MGISKKLTTLLLSLGLVAGMGAAAFAADNAAVNLLPYPNKGEFNKLVKYNPKGTLKPVQLMVQGANANYLPEPFSATKAASVKFKGSDGVTAGSTTVKPVDNGSNHVAISAVSVMKNLSYGSKMVNAKLPQATGWTGSIDLGVVLNPNSEVSAKQIKVSFYKGTPSAANLLDKKLTKKVRPNVYDSDIKYTSALDAAKTSVQNLTVNGSGINVYADHMKIKGKEYKNKDDGSLTWHYRAYDNKGNAVDLSSKVGAEVFPAVRHSNIVWIYGTWSDLPNKIATGLL